MSDHSVISPLNGSSYGSDAFLSPSTISDQEPLSGRLDRPLSTVGGYSMLPEAVPRPLESEKEVSGDDGKEVVAHEEKESAVAATAATSPSHTGIKPDPPYAGDTYRRASHTEDHPAFRKRRYCGLSVLVLGLIIGGVVIVAIALGVGLGVGLGSTANKAASAAAPSSSAAPTADSQTLIGGAIDPQYYSTTGAFNGTGLDINSFAFIANFPNTTGDHVILYFQHHSGDLRWTGYNDSGWYGGGPLNTIATDAKNNTPISTAAYSFNNTDYWRLYYVSSTNQVKERVLDSSTRRWRDGPLNKLNVQALDDERVGLLICYYANNNADTELSGASGVGLRLWAASNATTFQQLGWSASSDAWTYNQDWTGLNGHASPACYSWGGGYTSYVTFVDLNDEISIFWRDTSSGVIPTAKHPINAWAKTSISVPNIDPSTQLQIGVFAPNVIWAQTLDSHAIQGYTVTWQAENTTVDTRAPIAIKGGGGSALPGSHLALTVLPATASIPDSRIILFDQTEGNDVSVYTQWVGNLTSGLAWNMTSVPIPTQ